MAKSPKKVGKLPSKEIENLAKAAAKAGTYRLTLHAHQRMAERKVIELEIKQVLQSGRHNSARDDWDVKAGGWSYALEGDTVDERTLRVVVAFAANGTVIVTVVDLSK